VKGYARTEEPSDRPSGVRWARGSSRRRGLVCLLAALCSIAVVVVAAGTGAQPAGAQSSTNVLLKDPLSKPSSAMPDATFTNGNGSGSFVKGKYVLQSTGANVEGYQPTFDATAAQLSSTSVAVDVQFATPAAPGLAGLNCREGDTLGTRYVFLIRDGRWVVGKSVNPNGTVLKKGKLKIRPHETVHLQVECSGLDQPGPTGTVTLKFFINGKTVATVTDATSALPVTLPASIGMEVGNGRAAASFSNITVAQIPPANPVLGKRPPYTPPTNCTKPDKRGTPRTCGTPGY
jgi:hypothetical protein